MAAVPPSGDRPIAVISGRPLSEIIGWNLKRPPSQGWRTFLRNHADGIASMDLFVVPTISFRLLYGLLIMDLR
jgi:hypothetical protein